DELIATHIEPGGAVTASLDSGAEVMTKAIVDGKAQPITIEGTSPTLVFGIIFGADDLTGMPATAQLLAGMTVQMTVSSAGTTQLSVHLDGRSCAANTAVIHLVPDGKGHVDGDFSGTGVDGCLMSGTLSKIPIDQ
ncbi:MAG: hypothetical protein LC659_13155, partial [Myxococcales bacterium]|nr:hypothetical protein [Myxococcales bacterium]